MDVRKLLAGQNWPRAIEAAIESSDFFVACFSGKSVRKKGGFQSEIRYALDCARQVPLDEIYIVPVRLDDCAVPRTIQHELQYIDLFPDWDARNGAAADDAAAGSGAAASGARVAGGVTEPGCATMPNSGLYSSENDETRGSSRLLVLRRAVCCTPRSFLVYAETWAFTFDEGYHLLAAQLIAAGRTPYIDFCFPQTPLNAYWNAAWMRMLGWNWRVPHVLAALFTIGAVLLTADYVWRRFPVRGWRVAGAIAAALAIGLNGAVFEYGPVQAYGICLFGLAAGFRLAVRAVDRDGWLRSAGGGLVRRRGRGVVAAFGGGRSGAVGLDGVLQPCGEPVEEVRGFRHRGSLVPFAPVFWLFARGPRQTWFNLFRYHVFFRRLYWPETTRHDLEILTSWIDNGQALLLGLLALGGLVYVVRQSGWPQALKAEFYLCGWLALALSAEVGRAHPTFARYFLLTVPFLAILAVAGLFALSRAFEADRPLWPVLVVAVLLALGVGQNAVRTPRAWTTGAPTSAWRRRWIR